MMPTHLHMRPCKFVIKLPCCKVFVSDTACSFHNCDFHVLPRVPVSGSKSSQFAVVHKHI